MRPGASSARPHRDEAPLVNPTPTSFATVVAHLTQAPPTKKAASTAAGSPCSEFCNTLPAGRLIVGRSFTACATTVIATARLSTRFAHRYSVTAIVRAWRAAGVRLPPRRNFVPPHAVPMWRPQDWRRRHGHGMRRHKITPWRQAHSRRTPCPYDGGRMAMPRGYCSNNLSSTRAEMARRFVVATLPAAHLRPSGAQAVFVLSFMKQLEKNLNLPETN